MVMEPTRNVWIVVAAWFRRRGARVVLVPTTQSADLRAYYAKHTKNDRLDSTILARLPLLHPGRAAGVHRRRAGGSVAADREATFLDRRNGARRSSTVWMPSSSCSGRPGTTRWAPTTATPRCTSWPATPTRTA